MSLAMGSLAMGSLAMGARGLLLGLLLLLRLGPALAGEIRPLTVASATLGRDWAGLIYLPDGYDTANQRYKVVYLLHGANNDPSSWVSQIHLAPVLDRLIAEHRIPPCLVVMPSGGNSWYLDGAERMETALVQDLIPWVDTHYRSDPIRSARFVAGLSMGGYGAVHLALAHPQLFEAVAAMSPAVYTPEPPPQSAARRALVFQHDGHFDPALWQNQNYPALLSGYPARLWPLRLFVSAGAEDILRTGDAGALLAQAWRAQALPVQFHIRPGHHDFILWRHDIAPALRFLLSPEQAAPRLVAGAR
jgi:enterochelin esterase-like enzyme